MRGESLSLLIYEVISVLETIQILKRAVQLKYIYFIRIGTQSTRLLQWSVGYSRQQPLVLMIAII